MSDAVLTVEELTTRLKIGEETFPVVEEMAFSLHLGKTLALVGESGCGKTLTALSLLRILPKPPRPSPRRQGNLPRKKPPRSPRK